MREVIEKLKQYPSSDFYRFLIDGDLHKNEHGWIGYGLREPGCIEGVFNGFQYALDTHLADKTLSLELLQNIHLKVAQNVQNTPTGNHMNPGSFRTNISDFMLLSEEFPPCGYCNEQGISEIKTFIEKYHAEGAGLIMPAREDLERSYDSQEEVDQAQKRIRSAIDQHEHVSYQNLLDGLPWRFRTPHPEHVPILVEKLFSSYNHLIAHAVKEEDKLRIIVSHIQELERIHPFRDGNGRTSYILLQRLLIQNGFLPTLMRVPNHIDGFDQQSLIDEIQQGMKYTQALIDNPRSSLFGYQTELFITPPEPDELEKEFSLDLPLDIGPYYVHPDIIRSYDRAVAKLQAMIQSLNAPVQISSVDSTFFAASAAAASSGSTQENNPMASSGNDYPKN